MSTPELIIRLSTTLFVLGALGAGLLLALGNPCRRRDYHLMKACIGAMYLAFVTAAMTAIWAL